MTADPPLHPCSRCAVGITTGPDGVCVACEIAAPLEDNRCCHCGAPVLCQLPARLITTSGMVLIRVRFKARP